ncbi:uncharacterized protein LOC133928499 [Phragmites australis]|uniref:uncharacterized protein LOC133928499 n=1 Tax=Phragmites australis TaxID=29695 RepID=UPI002D7986B4|nr:uncharacterized protein LOC133928499 [Phragmites australis]
MLKIFKYTRAEECLLDEFMMHEEEEAMSKQHKSSKLRRGAPQFMPASVHARRTYNTLLLKSDSELMDRMIRETNLLTDELQDLNLERHQGSCQEFGNLTSKASTANAQRESHCYGKQAHESIVKDITYQAYKPVTANVKAALDGGQQYWKNVEISPSGKIHTETASCVSSKVLEYPIEDKNALVQSAPGVSEMTCEEQKIIGKPCSLAYNFEISEACSKSLAGVVAIGSMLIPIAM